jgi:hypothetical protein
MFIWLTKIIFLLSTLGYSIFTIGLYIVFYAMEGIATGGGQINWVIIIILFVPLLEYFLLKRRVDNPNVSSTKNTVMVLVIVSIILATPLFLNLELSTDTSWYNLLFVIPVVGNLVTAALIIITRPQLKNI